MQTLTHKLPNGKEIRLVTVFTLGVAINRDRQTIKRWEKQGILPKAPFSTKRGKMNVRLYPEYFVTALQKIVRELGLARGVALDKIISKAKIYEEIEKAKKEALK